jgi:hypothetical protein
VRRLAHEAADSGLLSPELAAGISRVKGVKQPGFRSGNWLSAEQSSAVLQHSCGDSMRAKRDYAMEQIQFMLGHASVQTTERYLGCKQNLGHPVNDLFDLAKDRRLHENDDESENDSVWRQDQPTSLARMRRCVQVGGVYILY